jgi:hypothetical protein
MARPWCRELKRAPRLPGRAGPHGLVAPTVVMPSFKTGGAGGSAPTAGMENIAEGNVEQTDEVRIQQLFPHPGRSHPVGQVQTQS